jgi:membrane protease YdiL (CAAX protease family)
MAGLYERGVQVLADEARGASEKDPFQHGTPHLATVDLRMSPRLDLPIAVACWLLGFAWVGFAGSWTPLAVLASLAAARLVLGDPGTRRLLQPRAGALALGAAGGVAMVGATYGLHRVLVPLFPALPGATRGLYGVLNSAGYRPLALGALVVVVSFCEEVVWRGRALADVDAGPGRSRLHGRALARVAAVALLYGAASLASGSLLLGALAAGCGFTWGLLRVAGRSLWPAVLTHAAWDLAVLVVWPLA